MGSGIKVPAGFQRGRWCREHTGHFCKSFRSQRRTYRRLLDIRKRTGTEDTVVIKRAPYIEPMAPNPMKMYAAEFFKNGKLQRNKIRHIQNTRTVSCGKIFRR